MARQSAITRVAGYHTCGICGWPDQKVKLLQYGRTTIYVCGGCMPRLAARIDAVNRQLTKEAK